MIFKKKQSVKSIKSTAKGNTVSFNLTGAPFNLSVSPQPSQSFHTAAMSWIAPMNVTAGMVSLQSNLAPYYPGQITYQMTPVTHPTLSYQDFAALWPYQIGELPPQDRELIKDFKTRHPDFDTFVDEINLIVKRKPGLLNTPLFMALIYDLAVQIRNITDSATIETVEEILDGKT